MAHSVPMQCTIKAPKTVAVNIRLGKQILVGPGETQSVDLTGDEVGAVEAHLVTLHRDNQVPTNLWGSVSCPERDSFRPAVGSKAHRAAHADEYVDGVHKSEKKAAKAAAAEAAKAK